MAKGRDEDSAWFRANPRKRQRHRLAVEGERVAGVEVTGLVLCVTNLGGLNRAYHICDARLSSRGREALEGYPVPPCSRFRCRDC